MKKWILFALIFAVFGAGSCLKNTTTTPSCSPVTSAAPASEVTTLKKYLDSNNISVTQDSRGFFYSIDSSTGSGTARPTICSGVSTTYLGTFLDGKVFDSSSVTNPASFNLSGVITGWQEAVPLMKLNNSMILYVPPSLAYGASGYGPIPGNSYLRFEIKLLAFN